VPKLRKKKVCKSSACGKEFEPFQSMQKVCGVSCAIALNSEKAITKRNKEIRKAKRDHYRSSLQWQHKKTQAEFNKMRRLEELLWFLERGKEPECISCGKTKMDWCCGHFKTVGAQSGLRYSPDNTKLQCNRYCNMGLSGNIDGNKTTRGYKQGLRDRFGDDEAERIIEYCETTTAPVKFTCDQLESDRAKYSARSRELMESPLINHYLK